MGMSTHAPSSRRPEPAARAPLPRLTAAICTRGRPEQLRRALRSLLEQRVPAAEILVVDNAPPGDETFRLVDREFPTVRYVCEPLPGLDVARNRALAEAVGDVIAFLDDDAVADTQWAGAIVARLAEEPRAGVLTGRVEALTVDTPGGRLFEANGGFGRGLVPIRLPADAERRLHGRRAPLIAWAVSVGSGCSYAVRRDLARSLGGFDEALDQGPPLPGGGDHDFLWRVLQAGHEVVYEPTALAWHEHRANAAAVSEQIVGHQRALVAFLVKHLRRARGRERVSLLGFLAWRLVKPGVRLVRRAVRRDPLPAAVLWRMWGACWRGLTAYGAAERRALRQRGAGGVP